MTLLNDLKNVVDRVKKYFTDLKILQIPIVSTDYRYDDISKQSIPADANLQDFDGIRIALENLSNVVDVDNKGISEKGSIVDSGSITHIFSQDYLLNTVRVIADCSSNIDLDIVVSYKNVLESDWIDIYSESLVPNDTKLNYRINISEYKSIQIKLTNNSGATLNYNLILFFSKIKFRDIKVVTPTDSLQVALDQGGVIYLTDGIHLITSALDFDQSKSLFIYGSGDESVIKTVGNIKVINITAVSSLTLSNFKIDAGSLTGNTKEIIDVTEANDYMVTLENIHVVGDGSHGIGIEINSDNCRLLKCVVESCYTGFYLRSVENVSLFQCIANNNLFEGVLSANSDNNRIISNYATGNYVGFQISNEDGSLIIGNHAKGNSHDGIHINGGNDCLITNNVADANDSDTANAQAGIYIEGLSYRHLVIGNISKNNNNDGAGNGHGIYLEDDTVNDTIVMGNHLEANDINFVNNGTGTIVLGSDIAYNLTTWNSNLGTATKNVIRDWIEAHLVADIHHDEDHTHEEEDITDLGSYLENVDEDPTPDLISSGVINIKSSGDVDDYLEFYTASNVPRIKVQGSTTLRIESSEADIILLIINTSDDVLLILDGKDDTDMFYKENGAYRVYTGYNAGTNIFTHKLYQDGDYFTWQLFDASVKMLLNSTALTMSLPIAMGTNKITGCGDPDDDQDVSTKKYVDDIVIYKGIASDDLVFSNDTERTTMSLSYVKLKEITSYRSVNLRVFWEMKRIGDLVAVMSKLYINGVAEGSEKSSSSTIYLEYTEDITINVDDLIQIYGHVASGSATCYIQNMRIKFIGFVSNDP